MQPEEVMMQAYAKPKKEGNKFGLVIAMGILLFLAAIAGIVFGVYEMMMRNSEVEEAKAECAKQVEDAKGTGCTGTKEVPTITNELAQTLIEPYIIPFNSSSNIFNYDYSEDVKAEIAYANIRHRDGTFFSDTDTTVKVYYYALNAKYKELFSGTNSLGRTDYNAGHSDTFKYSEGDGAEVFIVNKFNGGGTGGTMFDIVKSAEYDEDGNVIVVVYHDVVAWCSNKKETKKEDDEEKSEEEEDDDSGYCMETTDAITVRSVNDLNMKNLIERYESKIPKFKMKFVKQNDRLVLSNVSKN